MEQYIKSIKIDTFRGLHFLELNNLGQINILTGDNNSGKTSVLEVLRSLEDPTSFLVWRQLLRDNQTFNGLDGFSIYDGFYNLFDINLDKKEISYSVVMKNDKLDILLSAIEEDEEITERQYYKNQGLNMEEDKR